MQNTLFLKQIFIIILLTFSFIEKSLSSPIESLNIANNKPVSLNTIQVELLFIAPTNQEGFYFGQTALRLINPLNNLDKVYHTFDISQLENAASYPISSPFITNKEVIRQTSFNQFLGKIKKQDLALKGYLLIIPILSKKRLINSLNDLSFSSQGNTYDNLIRPILPNHSNMFRDLLNIASKKNLSFFDQQFNSTDERIQLTYRSISRYKYKDQPFLFILWDMFLNHIVDQPMSTWNRLILPTELDDIVSNFSRKKQNSTVYEQIFRIESTNIYNNSSENENSFSLNNIGPQKLWVLFLAPIFILLMMFIILRINPELSPLYVYYALLFDAFCSIWGLLSFLISTGYVWNWIFSSYEVLKGNLLLLLFWPFDILLPIIIIQKYMQSKKSHSSLLKFSTYYFGAHIIGIFIFSIVQFTSDVNQNIGYIVFYSAFIYILLFHVSKELGRFKTI